DGGSKVARNTACNPGSGPTSETESATVEYKRRETATSSSPLSGATGIALVTIVDGGQVEVLQSGVNASTVTGKHYFAGEPPVVDLRRDTPQSVPDPFNGKEKQTDIVGSRRTEHAFVQTGSYAAQICQTNTTLLDSAAQEKNAKRLVYDAYDNVTDVYEYPFG